ncbi:MAG: carbon storage regulator [Pirellulales bacterium]
MLVLSRKIGERILIGDKIAVTVVRIGHGGVRIGIEAPSDLLVIREELAHPVPVTAGDPPQAEANQPSAPRPERVIPR